METKAVNVSARQPPPWCSGWPASAHRLKEARTGRANAAGIARALGLDGCEVGGRRVRRGEERAAELGSGGGYCANTLIPAGRASGRSRELLVAHCRRIRGADGLEGPVGAVLNFDGCRGAEAKGENHGDDC